MDKSNHNRVVLILRWIAFIPLAITASVLGWYLVNILGRLGLYFVQFDTESFIAQLYFNAAGNTAMAIAFVYTGSKIAPLHNKTVAYFLSVVWLVFSGFALYAGIMVKNSWAIFGGIWGFVVILIFAFFVYQNKT
ncbi:MAG: hypothetical protein SCM96_12835 [Acidobacteriota bacterium]|nr:hypothetical protein [Acidobacteriota bacterium]